MKKRLIFSFAFVFFVVVFGIFLLKKPSFQPSKAQEKTLSLNIVSEPSSLDPRKARTLNDLNIIRMCLEGLTRTQEDLSPGLALAATITPSQDFLSYAITLKDATWSDGSPITSEDFLASYKSSLGPSFPSDYAFMLYAIKNGENIKKGQMHSTSLGVELINKKSFVIHLERPTPQFLELLSHPIWFPIPHHIEKTNSKWAESDATYVSSGPFKCSKWKHGNMLIVSKNPQYWDSGHVYLDSIKMHMVSPETGFSMFLTKELDWDGSPFSSIPLDALGFLEDSQELHAEDFLISYFLRTNTTHPLLKSKNLRKALATSLHRKEMIDHVMQGYGVYASSLTPSCLLSKSEELFTDNSPSLAQSFLQKALEEDGICLEELNHLKLSFISSEKSFRICQTLKEQWRKNLGIHIQLEPLEAKVFFSNVSKKNYQLTLGSWVADFRDPISFLEIFRNKSIGTNNTGWEHPLFTNTLEKSYQASNTTSRNTLLSDCEKILVEDMPIIPLCFGKMLYVKKASVKNVIISATGAVDFKSTYQADFIRSYSGHY